MPRIQKRISSSKKKKKNKDKMKSSSSSSKRKPMNITTTDFNEILSQADIAYETSNVESALQLYSYAQLVLQQTLQKQEKEQQQEQNQLLVLSNNHQFNKDDFVSNMISYAKVSCKIGEIKASFHDPNDKGYDDFIKGINLLSKENEQKYLLLSSPSSAVSNDELKTTESTHHDNSVSSSSSSSIIVDNLMIQAQWKEVRANLYMYLGQLSNGIDALTNFNVAVVEFKECIEVLEQSHSISCNKQTTSNSSSQLSIAPTNNMDQSSSIEVTILETSKQLCGAYCSIAELYMTDLCFEPNAEQECEKILILALDLDKKQQLQLQCIKKNSNSDEYDVLVSPDASQVMANFRLCQSRYMEAIPYILDAYSRMKDGCEAMADLVGLGHQSNMQSQEKVENNNVAKELKEDALKATEKLPGFEFRCQTAKILLECAATLEESKTVDEISTEQGQQLSIEKKEEQRIYCVEAAIQVLGSLIAENDEVIEIWYLLGCAFQSKSINHYDTSKHHFETALEMLMRTKEEMEQCSDMHIDEINQNDENDCNPLKDVLQKIEDVKGKIKEVASTGMNED